MKKQFYLGILAFFILFGCKNTPKNQNATTNTTTATTAKGLVQCFQLNQNKDLTTCQITTDEKGFVGGYMDWSPFEKDGGHGILKNGKMEGNMLTADWAYSIEGSVQTEEVYLKIEGDKVTQMRGELVEDKTGRLIAKDKSKLTAGDVMAKVDCAAIEETVKNIESMPNIAACYAPPTPINVSLPKEVQLLVECDERNNMKWGEKPIKDFDTFKKVMTAELADLKKRGVNPLPALKVTGCLMGASSELYTIYAEVKEDLMKAKPSKPIVKNIANKPKVTEVNAKKIKPTVTSKSVTMAPPSVTLYQNGDIKVDGKSVPLENVKKELQAKLTQYAIIPDKDELKTVGETGMGMRAEVRTEIDEAIAGAKWIRKKAALAALNTPISKKMTLPTQLEVGDYQTYANYAFVVAVVRQANGKPVDFNKTPFSKQYSGGSFSEDVFGVLKYENGSWQVLDYALGATDVPYGCWWKEHNVPKALFKKYEEVLCSGETSVSTHKSETVQFAKGKSDAALTRAMNATSTIDFNFYAKKGQNISFTIGYDFKDSDVEGFLTEPGLQDISLTTGPKNTNEFKVKRTGHAPFDSA